MKVSYNSGDGIIEIVVRDETGAKIDHFKANLRDNKRQKFISAMLKDKYGLDLVPMELDKEKEGFFDF